MIHGLRSQEFRRIAKRWEPEFPVYADLFRSGPADMPVSAIGLWAVAQGAGIRFLSAGKRGKEGSKIARLSFRARIGPGNLSLCERRRAF